MIRRNVFGAPERAQVIETHISWVILTGSFAYKLKKPVKLGFLDFSTLESRRRACIEELRLNRRLAPEFYVDLVGIYGSEDEPVLDARGPPIEYAVRMRQFPPGSVLSGADAAGLSDTETDALAELVGRFHQSLPPAPDSERWGRPQEVRAPADASVQQLRDLLPGPAAQSLISRATEFLDREFRRNDGLMEKRRLAGFVRECHGDLHLGNLFRVAGRIVPFDALEFDPALRWIDVLSEVAFLVMDLEIHGRGRHPGFRFLNRYLDITGDHDGVPVLPYYLSYRALVRAKVTALSPGGQTPEQQHSIGNLLRYASNPRAAAMPMLLLTCGISGSGKSHLASQVAVRLPAIHIRSDVERKRLFGVGPLAQTDSAVEAGIYSPAASARTYQRLASIAATMLGAGLPVIVDATNLRRTDREPFLSLAREAGHPAAILMCTCDFALIETRVQQRNARRTDPSEAGIEVALAQQPQLELPLSDEAPLVLHLDTGASIDPERVTARLHQLMAQRTP